MTKSAELIATRYQKDVVKVISTAVGTLYDEIKKRGDNLETVKADKDGILAAIKAKCRYEIAHLVTRIINNDEPLKSLYASVRIVYNETEKSFKFTMTSSVRVEAADASTATEPATPLANFIEGKEKIIKDALQKMSDEIDGDLDSAFETATTNYENNADRYKRTANRYKTAGAVLTVLAYLAELGAVAATIPLFMEADQLLELYHQAVDAFPNFDSYVEFGPHHSMKFTHAFHALDAQGQQAILSVLDLQDEAIGHLIPGVFMVVFAAALMGFSFMIYKGMEGTGAEKVQQEILSTLGVNEPNISQSTIDKATHSVRSGETPNVRTPESTAVENIAARLGNLKNALETHAHKETFSTVSIL